MELTAQVTIQVTVHLGHIFKGLFKRSNHKVNKNTITMSNSIILSGKTRCLHVLSSSYVTLHNSLYCFVVVVFCIKNKNELPLIRK